ncbi:hypothetical protein TNCT_710751 [Trichonephila clavata]|uniref:Uncharacterized protein n=1 Tax=Trichonephila clavata TaxID=2740835 RepID=A0A8X6F374_TRICU|nr:hypothetical protein TNCT_710751 [Trichonephila clavata]
MPAVEKLPPKLLDLHCQVCSKHATIILSLSNEATIDGLFSSDRSPLLIQRKYTPLLKVSLTSPNRESSERFHFILCCCEMLQRDIFKYILVIDESFWRILLIILSHEMLGTNI